MASVAPSREVFGRAARVLRDGRLDEAACTQMLRRNFDDVKARLGDDP